MSGDESDFFADVNAENFPGLWRWATGVFAALCDDHNPEQTLPVQVTVRELGAIVFGLHLVRALFPECRFIVGDLNDRLIELAAHHSFAGWTDEDAPKLDDDLPNAG